MGNVAKWISAQPGRSRLIRALGLAVILAAVGFLSWYSREPTYQGKTAAMWFNELIHYGEAPDLLNNFRVRDDALEVFTPDRHSYYYDPWQSNAIPPIVGLRALGPTAVWYLIHSLNTNQSLAVRAWAAIVQRLPPGWQPNSTRSSEPTDVRSFAYLALRGMGDRLRPEIPALIDSLRSGLRNPNSPLEWSRMIDVLAHLKATPEQWLPLVQELDRQRMYDRLFDLIQRLDLRSAEVTELILGIVGHGDDEARRRALAELVGMKFSAERFIDLFARGLSDPDEQMRYLSARGLEEIGPPAAAWLPALATALRDQSSSVRIAVGRAITTIGAQAPVAPAPR